MSKIPDSSAQQGAILAAEKPPSLSEKQELRSSTTSSDAHQTTEVAVADTAKPAAPPSVPLLSLWRYATKFELFINFVGLLCSAGAGAMQPLMTLIFGRLTTSFVDFGHAAKNAMDNPGDAGFLADLINARRSLRDDCNMNALYLTIIGIAMFVGTYMYMAAWVYTAETISRRIRERYLGAVLRQDIAYFDKLGAGEVATRIETDTHLIQQGISEKVALAVQFLAAFVAGFIIAFIRQPKLAGVLFVIMPCIAVAGGTMTTLMTKYQQLALEAVAESGSLAEEVISTVRTAKAFGTQKILASLYDTHLVKARTVGLKGAVVMGCGLGTFFFIIYSSYALAFVYGTTLVLRNETDVGVVVNVFLAILIGAFSLAMIAPELQAIAKARGAAAKIYDTIDRIPPIDSASPLGEKPENVEGHITFENVNFRYPARPNVPILKSFSATFPKGKVSALVGASGSGKSTIVSLIERFYDPESGVIRLDGHELKSLNIKFLRGKIGLVGQEPVLFNATVRENIEHGLIGTPLEQLSADEKLKLVKAAAVKANADGFISNLPLGYDNNVGERGMLLSGGQKQRIAIARAIVSDPLILLLDEATSALDTQSEGIVQDALDKASQGRTTIVIAHRLSTVRDAHQILVMGGGELLETGTHEELLTNPDSPYSRLVAAQKLAAAKQGEENSAGPAALSREEAEELAQKEQPLARVGTGHSIASEILAKRKREEDEEQAYRDKHSMFAILKRMLLINWDAKNLYMLGTLGAIASGLVYPCFGIVFGRTLQSFADYSGDNPSELRHEGDRNGLWFFIIAIAATIAIFVQTFCMTRTSELLTFKLRALSFRALLRQDVKYFDNSDNSTGALTSQLADNAQKVQGLAGVTLGTIIQSIATLVGGIIIGVANGWKLGLVGTACIPLTVCAGYIRLQVVVLKDQKNKKAHDESAQLACEAAGAIRTVASLTREDDCSRIYHESLEAPARLSHRTSLTSNAIYALSQALAFWVIALIFWYGAGLLISGEYNPEKFFIVLMSVVFASIQAGNVFSFVPDISSAKGGASRTMTLLDSEPEIDSESEEGLKLDHVEGHLRFEDVHFRYPTRPDVRVLRSLNLEIKPGTYVALVGPSGCGKSTTIQLIERYYDAIVGRITLDGHELTSLNVANLRRHIALVSQEPTLYQGTIKYNILLGAVKPAEEVTQEELEQACRDANILDFIKQLPDKFDTQVGGKGTQLSGGQKQRIAIARALIRQPKILLLDEATSALDSESEKVVQAALDNAARGRTTIAIAHRLSTIQKADIIYVFKDGRVSQAGTHNELLQDKAGLYAELVALQELSKRD